MKKFVTIIGGLSLATSLALAQTGSSGPAGTQHGVATNTGAPPSYQYDPAFGASGGSGHGVGINGGTHSGPLVGSPHVSTSAATNDSAFGASGGSGHSVGVRGGTHSGPMVSTPNPSAGASVNYSNAPSAPNNR
jgi:hypothetical protein